MTAFTSTDNEQPDAYSPSDHAFGGQAVIEGVMMRGRHSWGVAVRRPSGDIARVAYPLPPAGSRNRVARFPVVRGVVALYESLSLGIKALRISANIGLEEVGGETQGDTPLVDTTVAPPGEGGKDAKTGSEGFGGMQMGITVFVSLVLAVGLFIVVPLVVAKQFGTLLENPFLFNLVEGVIRLVIFIAYLLVATMIPDLRRVWEYHGAEHKVIHAYESCGRADAEYAKRFPTLHPRCGTGFLLLVFVLAVFLFAFVGRPSYGWLILSRVIGIPIIVGIAYEIGIKWAGRHATGLVPRIILWPGIQLQRLTTREPSIDQLYVAAAALEEVMIMDQAEMTAQKEALALT